LLHTSINAFGAVVGLFNASIVTGTDLAICIAMVVPALLIVVLTRGTLGYEPAQGRSVESGRGGSSAGLAGE
jgi:hypothetical protein